MNVSELIAVLKQLPPDMPVYHCCGGDCPGYAPLGKPMLYKLWPFSEAFWYQGTHEGCPHDPPDYPARVPDGVSTIDAFVF